MSETRTDYAAMAHEQIAEMNTKRGLVAAELSACEGELREMRGEIPGQEHTARHRRGQLALDAILGDARAVAELEALEEREAYLERRAGICRAAIAHADERIEGLRNTWLQGTQVADLPLDGIPEVLRERVRATREAADA